MVLQGPRLWTKHSDQCITRINSFGPLPAALWSFMDLEMEAEDVKPQAPDHTGKSSVQPCPAIQILTWLHICFFLDSLLLTTHADFTESLFPKAMNPKNNFTGLF